jgi:hypothetical protein
MSQLTPNSALYIISSGLHLKGRISLGALDQSFNEIARRHEVLRTRFATVEGRVVQVIDPTPCMIPCVVDLAELSRSEQVIVGERLAREEAQRPFDLSRGPLIRLRLLRFAADEHGLVLTMHHIVTDGWSISVFTREITGLYESFSIGAQSQLPELAIQYADYAYWQRQWLQGEALDSQLDYWKRQLANAPWVLDLAKDRPRPAVRTFRSGKQSFALSPALSSDLSAFSRRERVTLFMTLLAAYQTLLHLYAGEDIVCVGSPIANRNRAETESLIGYFINILALCTDLSGNPGFRELLGRVREMTLGAYANQDLPFERIVEALHPERGLGFAPLVQVTFTFQNARVESLEMSDLSLSPVAGCDGTVEYDLSLLMAGEAEGLGGSFVYNTDLFDAAIISRMIDHFRIILEHVVADPERRLLDIPLRNVDRERIAEAALQLQLSDQAEQFDCNLS